jgi:hypothetical protein
MHEHVIPAKAGNQQHPGSIKPCGMNQYKAFLPALRFVVPPRIPAFPGETPQEWSCTIENKPDETAAQEPPNHEYGVLTESTDFAQPRRNRTMPNCLQACRLDIIRGHRVCEEIENRFDPLSP